MTSTINASTSGGGGIIQTADSSGTLALQGGGNTGVSIDSSGNATGTTQSQANNSTRLSTTAYVDRVAVQQVVSTITGAVATGTTGLPWDDTIPQNTEGDQYMTLAVTPKSATSKLEITVVGNFACSTSEIISMALFQDSTANALQAVAAHDVAANLQNQLVIEYVMTSGTTSATTFKVRAGPNTSGTITFNGSSSGRKFGGVMASSIIITEIGV
jgi:hypothetical protein